nr:polymorphic toxin-type HINT domain-containing protein [Micromonospora sp. DSM 115978]
MAGIACSVATGGVGAVACMVGAGALINLAKDAAQGDIHSLGDALGSAGTGALMGLGGGAAGAVAARVGTVVASRAGAGIGSRLATEAVENGVENIINQTITTGRVDLKSAALGVAPGLNLLNRRRGGTAPARAPPRGGSCQVPGRPHSFDPATPVLMADGSSRPIEDVNVGDRVIATDPQTGVTAAKPVTQLHRNTDRELTDLTVTDHDGDTSTLSTTPNHPFWNETQQTWTDAGDLTPGTRLKTTGRGEATVTTITTHTRAQEMRDLRFPR